MGKRIYSTKKIKYWWAYDVEEIADLLSVTPKTIGTWIKQGLPTMANGKPVLIYGYRLREFIKERNQSNKKLTAFKEMFCMKCKDARKPYKNQVAIELVNNNTLLVKAVCTSCKSKMNKGYKLDDLPKLKRTFATVEVSRLYDTEYPPLKVNLLVDDKSKEMNLKQTELFSDLML